MALNMVKLLWILIILTLKREALFNKNRLTTLKL